MPAERVDESPAKAELAEKAEATVPTELIEDTKAEATEPPKKDAPIEPSAIIQTPPVSIPPPPPGVQLAVGMQLFQQSAGLFHQLDKEVQLRMLGLADKFDDNAFANAQENLRLNHDHRKDRLEKIWKTLVVMAILVGAGLVAATVVTVLLIQQGKPELAKDLIIIGISVITSLLGGAGAVQLFKGLSGSGNKD